jgi:hypothetical protein
LTPHRSQTTSTHSLAGSQALVEIELWDGKPEYISEAFAQAEKNLRVTPTLNTAPLPAE